MDALGNDVLGQAARTFWARGELHGVRSIGADPGSDAWPDDEGHADFGAGLHVDHIALGEHDVAGVFFVACLNFKADVGGAGVGNNQLELALIVVDETPRDKVQAVDGKANDDKGASDASDWLPPNKQYDCRYVARQIAVKQKYRLWVTPAEHYAIQKVLNSCPTQPLPIVN